MDKEGALEGAKGATEEEEGASEGAKEASEGAEEALKREECAPEEADDVLQRKVGAPEGKEGAPEQKEGAREGRCLCRRNFRRGEGGPAAYDSHWYSPAPCGWRSWTASRIPPSPSSP